MLNKLTIDDFSGRVMEPFTVQFAEGEKLRLELVEVNPLSEDTGSQNRVPFSLIFRNDNVDGYLPQQIYRLSHPLMGEMDLFLVPLGPHQDGMRYEALFT